MGESVHGECHSPCAPVVGICSWPQSETGPGQVSCQPGLITTVFLLQLYDPPIKVETT